MSNPVIGWAKENPVAAGAAALGVIVVVMLVAGGGDEESQTQGSAGLGAYYSAVAMQNQAGAAIRMKEIEANATTNQTLLASTYALERDKLAAGVATQQIGSNEKVGMYQIDAYKYAVDADKAKTLAVQETEQRKNASVIASLPMVKKKNRDDVLKSFVTGDYGYAGPGGPSKTAQVIGSVGQAAGGIAKAIGSIGGIF